LNDGLNWASLLVTEYKVYGTPTIFLLDKDLTIIAKPSTFEELLQELKY
jgi:hypothetical protein